MSLPNSQPTVFSNATDSTPLTWEQIMEIREKGWPGLYISIEDIPQLLRQWYPFEKLEAYPPGFLYGTKGFYFDCARYATLGLERIARAEQLAATTGMPYVFNPTTGTIDLLSTMELGPSVDEKSEEDEDEGTPPSLMPELPSVPQTVSRTGDSAARDSVMSVMRSERSTDDLFPSEAKMAYMSGQEFGNRAGAHNFGMPWDRRPPPGPVLAAQLVRQQASQPPSTGEGSSVRPQHGQSSSGDVSTSQQQPRPTRQDSNVVRPPVPLYPWPESEAGK